jgi:hypothetical protein
LKEKVEASVYKTENTVVGIRHADHTAPSIRKNWHQLRCKSECSKPGLLPAGHVLCFCTTGFFRTKRIANLILIDTEHEQLYNKILSTEGTVGRHCVSLQAGFWKLLPLYNISSRITRSYFAKHYKVSVVKCEIRGGTELQMFSHAFKFRFR